MDTDGSFPRIKWSGLEANHVPPSSVEVKKKWSYSSTSSTCIHGLQRDDFTSSTSRLEVKVLSVITTAGTPPAFTACGKCHKVKPGFEHTCVAGLLP